MILEQCNNICININFDGRGCVVIKDSNFYYKNIILYVFFKNKLISKKILPNELERRDVVQCRNVFSFFSYGVCSTKMGLAQYC